MPAVPTIWHIMPIADIWPKLDSGPGGLGSAEVARRLASHGPNRLPEPDAYSLVQAFLRQFLSPLIYILGAAAIFSLWSGEQSDAIFIFAILLINAVIGTVQEAMAERAAQALHAMVPLHAMVFRNGQPCNIPAEQLVPGDVVLLASGDKIPADLRLMETHSLQVDESLLTGESMAVSKQAGALVLADTTLAERTTMGFAGTLIVSGRATGIVVAIGKSTEIGRIAASIRDRKKIKPPLLARIDQLSLRLAFVMLLVIVCLGTLSLAHGHSLLVVIPVAIALAVAAVPEGMPAAITVALAVGMRRMARQNVIVRRMVAIETLGSCSYIASDKTGTLTQNEITVERILLPDGTGFHIQGESITEETGETSTHPMLRSLVRAAVLTNEAKTMRRGEDWEHTGDKVDISLLMLGRKWGLLREDALAQHPAVSVVPYESEQGFSAALHEDSDDRRLFVKGSMEKLLPMCSLMQADGSVIPLDTARIEAQMDALAKSGYRVLAFAERRIASDVNIDNPKALMQDMTFLGLAGMIDPLRPEAAAAIAQCHQAGIRVAMITGDHPVTALAIARQLALETQGGAVTGAMIDAAKDQESLSALVKSSSVFARIAPEQKRRIVECLVECGHCVAVTGDGVNDAPALRAAHVGIAMGKRGTDLARESAEIILTDDNFASVVAGIREGRIVYANIRKVIFHFISIGMAEILLFMLAIGTGLPMPLTTVQLLWLNLVTGGMQDLPLTLEKGEGGELQKKPRPMKEPIFDRRMIERVALNACFIGLTGFGVYAWLLQHGYTESAARNMLLLLMVLYENAQVLNSRSESRCLIRIPLFSNPLLVAGILLSQAVQVIAMHSPFLQRLLEVQPIEPQAWLYLLVLTLLLIGINELYKIWRSKI